MEHSNFHLCRAIPLALSFILLATTINGDFLSGLQQPTEKEKVEEALAILRDTNLLKSDPDPVMKAMSDLGQLRDPAAIEDLVKLLAFRIRAPWEKDPNRAVDFSMPRSRGMIYPAVNALVEIGPRSLPALMKVIETHEPDSLETRNAMEAIVVLSRYERPGYVQKLKDAAASASSVETVQRLLKAAETLEQTKR